ncbi:uncharacterized protein LOC101851001 [Aplysia californica]|uniref:Uncharacterized protein LOC101851001 n=1 Tax=Aplysia californica TaxID=6500 RepID=A0ABM0K8T7_APLCA|nr:uncharacterized protein LOC101851001 [Aplysia californica]
MGIKGLASNRKRKAKCRKSEQYHRALKQEKKKRLPPTSLEIEDVHLFSKEKLRNKFKNPKNNIQISGKKRRRLTKRLGHALREKSQMDVEVESSRATKAQAENEDSAMADLGETEQDLVPPEVPSTSSASSSTKKKRRGGKKQRKKQTSGAKDNQTDDGWEDVDMGEDEDL